jgi:ribonuclease HI
MVASFAERVWPDIDWSNVLSGKKTISILFDGGSLGNPGQGYGSYCVYRGKRPGPIISLDFGDDVTNNQAEYRTLISAVEAILDEARASGADPADFHVQIASDSKLVIEQLGGRWKVRNKGLQPLHAEAKHLLDQFGETNLRWIPRARVVAVLGH